MCDDDGPDGRLEPDQAAANARRPPPPGPRLGQPHPHALLETLREFARLRLVAGSSEDATHARHAEHYAGVVAQAATRMLGPEEPHWSDLVVVEMPNLRAAFQWACGSERLDVAFRLFTPLHPNSPLPTAVVHEIGSWASTSAALAGAAAHPSFADVCAWGLAAADVAGDRTAGGVWVDRANQPGVARPARLLAQFAQVTSDFDQMLSSPCSVARSAARSWWRPVAGPVARR